MTHAPPLVLYDAACGFCARQVQFLLRHDQPGTLRFAPLNGLTALALATRHPQLATSSSMVWVDDPGGPGERVRIRSEAVLAVAAHLGGLWRLGRVGAIIPVGWRDAIYDGVARHRHRLGSRDCIAPTQDQAARFLP